MTEALTCPYCASVDTSYKKKAEQWECNDCEKRFDAPNATKQRPQRIFLSYGHDENTSLVLELRQRLEAVGHNVWIDQTQIKVGDDWRLAIKKGLLESDRVLSFLSKHSTRDPGVCLDEIGIALAHRHGAIATLLVEPIEQVRPPPSLAHIQYLNLSNWRQERDAGEPHWTVWLDAQAAILIDIIARNEGFAGEMDELQRLLKPHTQSGRLGNLVERSFCGREWLFDEIAAWRSGQNDRTFWLVADPGMGKSAVAARLAHTTAQHTVAYHFCRFDEPSTRSPETFVCTLAFQLAARLPGYRQLLLYATRYLSKPLIEQNADDLFSLLLTSPLRSSIDGGQSEDRLLVIVDALDEAPAIADLLARRQGDLPNWVALLLTSRPDTLIQSAMAGISPRRLSNDDPRNQGDLEAFVKQWFESSQPAPPAHARAALLKNSQGNILYLATAREGVKAGVFDLDNPEAYPKGLGGLYRNWFDRKFGSEIGSVSWPASYALLELVCASPEPLPIYLARQTLHWVGQDRVLACRPMGSLIQEQDNAIELFHRSLAEWLQDTVLADRYWVNVQDGRIRLAKTIWGTLQEVIKAQETGYAHRVLPRLLLAIPKNLREEIFGEGEQRFALMDELGSALKNFQEHKIRLSRLDLANVYAQECESYYGETSEQCMNAKSKLAFLLMDVTSEYFEAKRIIEKVIAVREEVLGPEHPDTAEGFNNLADLLKAIGNYEAALPLFERSVAIWEKVLGPDHPDTATGVNNLADLLKATGDYKKARPLFERALSVREKVLGPDHPKTAMGLNNLAGLLMASGDYKEARPLYERSVAIWEKVLGPNHPDTATGLSNLAHVLKQSGDYEAARPLFQRSLMICEKVLGTEHPYTAGVLINLADLLKATGDYKKARPLFERALSVREKVLGPDHPDTAVSLNNLASFFKDSGDYDAARPLFERALVICEKVLGPDHPDTALSLNNLAGLLEASGDYKNARLLFERAVAIWEKVLGYDHPYTVTGLNNLANLLKASGDSEAARPLFERLLVVREKVLGPDHPDTVESLNSLADLLKDSEDYEAARPLFERALIFCEKFFGPDHPNTAAILNNLAGLLEASGDYDAARPLFERALVICEKVLGPDNSNTELIFNNLTGLLKATGDYSAVEPLYRRSIGLLEMTLGDSHPKTLTAAIDAGVLIRDHMNQGDAQAILIDVIKKCESMEEYDATIYTRSLSALGKLHEMQHQKNEAIQCYEKCLEIRLETLGKDHESTVLVKDRLMKLTDS